MSAQWSLWRGSYLITTTTTTPALSHTPVYCYTCYTLALSHTPACPAHSYTTPVLSCTVHTFATPLLYTNTPALHVTNTLVLYTYTPHQPLSLYLHFGPKHIHNICPPPLVLPYTHQPSASFFTRTKPSHIYTSANRINIEPSLPPFGTRLIHLPQPPQPIPIYHHLNHHNSCPLRTTTIQSSVPNYHHPSSDHHFLYLPPIITTTTV